MHYINSPDSRGRSRAAATSKMECFVIIVNDFQPLTIIAKHSTLDDAAALDPPPLITNFSTGTSKIKLQKSEKLISVKVEYCTFRIFLHICFFRCQNIC